MVQALTLIFNSTDLVDGAAIATQPCAFKKATWYEINLKLVSSDTSKLPTWTLYAYLNEMKSGTISCSVSYNVPTTFNPAAFLANNFKLVVSQSALGANSNISPTVASMSRKIQVLQQTLILLRYTLMMLVYIVHPALVLLVHLLHQALQRPKQLRTMILWVY